MTTIELHQIITNILVDHFSVKEEDCKLDTPLLKLYPDFIFLSNVLLFEELVEKNIQKPLQLKERLNIIDATLADVINYTLQDFKSIK